jgi:hypothetical protein
MYAILLNKKKITILLLVNGANPLIEDDYGTNCFSMCKELNSNIIDILNEYKETKLNNFVNKYKTLFKKKEKTFFNSMSEDNEDIDIFK